MRIVSFDCYGTLVDWLYTIRNFLRFLKLPDDALTTFFQIENRLILSSKFIKYGDILKICLRETCKKFGINIDESLEESLVLCFSCCPPFPDVYPCFKRLKELGFKIVVFSNTEKWIIDSTLRTFRNLIDMIVTAEDIQCYKPSRSAFEKFLEVLRTEFGIRDPSEVVHVSAYPWYDLETANSLGMCTVLVDRYGYEWHVKVRNLIELPDVVLRTSMSRAL